MSGHLSSSPSLSSLSSLKAFLPSSATLNSLSSLGFGVLEEEGKNLHNCNHKDGNVKACIDQNCNNSKSGSNDKDANLKNCNDCKDKNFKACSDQNFKNVKVNKKDYEKEAMPDEISESDELASYIQRQEKEKPRREVNVEKEEEMEEDEASSFEVVTNFMLTRSASAARNMWRVLGGTQPLQNYHEPSNTYKRQGVRSKVRGVVLVSKIFFSIYTREKMIHYFCILR